MRTRKRKLHIAHILTVSLVWLILSAGGDVALSAWQPPIGIPEPPFGITTTHMMYADAETYTYDYGSGPEPYRIGPDGPYTHYVDPDHPSATDTDNPYGTHTIPRVTRPNIIVNLPAGSVVEMHSGWQPDVGPINGSGTPSLPIFIRGVEGDCPTWTGVFQVRGDYVILENMIFDQGVNHRVTIRIGDVEGPRTNVAVRGCEFYNGEENPSQSYQVIRIKYSFDDSSQLENIVIYNNHFHNIGDGRTTEVKDDVLAVSVDANARYIWIVDNYMHHLGGDGVGIAYDSFSENRNLPHHIYVGRNVSHDNFENFIDLKVCEDVIISQNIAYNFGEGYSAIDGGTSMPFRYGLGEGPDDIGRNNVWTLFNVAYNYNSPNGGFSSFTGSGETLADEIYYIGNIVYNSHNDAGTSTGFFSSGAKKVYWLNNTAYNCDRAGFFIGDGVGDAPTEKLTLVNNIFGDIASGSTQPYSLMIGAVQASLDRMVIKNNVFYNSGGNAQFRVGVYDPSQAWTTYSTYSAFRTAYPGFCTDSVEADPKHVDAINNDFHLQSNSPAIDAGTSSGVVQEVFDRFQQLYGIDIRKDIEGTPRTGAWDIGAYEYGQGLVLSLSSTSGGSVTNPGEGSFPYDDVTVVSIEATADYNYYFVNWTGTAVDAGKVANASAASTTVTVDAYYTIQANFATDLHTLTISSTTSDGSVTNPGEGPFLYDDGTVVLIQATAADNYHFVNWTGTAVDAGQVADPGSASTTVAMNADYTLQANFSIDQHNLTISSTSGGTVTTPGEGTYPYDHGTAASLIAAPTAHYHFVNWTGTAVDAGKVANTNAASTTVTADANYTIQANFAIDQHTLTISSTSGGSVTNPGEGPFQYDHGTDVSIQATADYSYYFVNWTGTAVNAGKVANPNAASTTITADADYTIQANFGEPDGIAPTVTNCSPAAGDIQVPLNSLISLHVTDAGIGVEAKSVKIKVRINNNPNNDTVYFGDTDHYISPEGDCRRLGTKADYRFVYQPTNEMLYYDQTVTITVNAADLAGSVMDEYSYSFATEMHSFGQNKQVNLGLANNDRPVTVCDSSGNIWSAWQAGLVGSRDIYISKLAGGEENFGSTIQLTNNANDQCNPAVALDSNDKLYVVWQDNREGDWDIYVSTSVDGVNWSTEIRINDPNEGNQVNPAIVIDGQDFAHVVWQDDSAGNQDIYVATSSDGFATPTVSQQITFDNFDQVEPAVAADFDNTIYVIWTDGRNGSNDIYGAASNNSWTNVAIVSNTNNQSSPAIAAEPTGSILHLLWIDDASGNNDIYYTSSDGLPGSPLTGSSIIDDSSGADQLDPTIAVTGSSDNNLKVFACWQDWRNTDTDLYFAELSSGSGTNVFVDDGGSNTDQGEPAVGIDEYGHPYIMWADSRSTNTDIYYAGSTFIEPVALASELITASASSSTIVGTDPQAITTVDDVSIVVPAGACSYDVTITVAKIANLPAFAAPCLGGYDFGPSGIQFSQPVTITIPYAFSGSDGSVTPYWFNSLTGALSQQGITDIQDIPISSSLHALSFKTTHFTAFFLFAGGGAAAIVSGGGGGGGCSVSTSGEGNIVEYMLPYIALAVVMVILKMRDARDRKGT